MLHIKNGKVKGTISVFLAERLASAPLMKQMDHTLDPIHNYVAPRITDKGCALPRKSSASAYLRFEQKSVGVSLREEKWNLLC